MSLQNKQLQEANALFKEAKGYLGRTITRWSPDYDSAATRFDKAAIIFKNLKMNKEHYDSLKEAANAHYRASNLFFAAKAVENAGNVLLSEKKYEQALTDFEKAAVVYQEDGKPERAADCLKNAARNISDKLEIGALTHRMIAIYKQALTIYADSDNNHLSEEGYRAFNSYLVKQNMFTETIENMKEQIKSYESLKQNHNIYKCALSIVILYLAKDDWSAAFEYHNSAMEKYTSYFKEDECSIATDLLQAFEGNDPELLKKTLAKNKIKFLENSISQLCKRLKINPNLVGSKPNVSATKKVNLDNKKAALFDGMDDDDDGEEQKDEDNKPEEQHQSDDDTDLTGEKKAPASKTQAKSNHKPSQPDNDEEGDIFDPNSLV